MKRLSQRESAFCVHYTALGTDTFENGTNVAIAAGYSQKSAHVAASRLLKRDKVRKKILELHAENMSRNNITVDKVLADLEHDKLMARKAGQYSVSLQCTIAQGKYLAMFTDNVQQSGDGLSIIVNSKKVEEETDDKQERPALRLHQQDSAQGTDSGNETSKTG